MQLTDLNPIAIAGPTASGKSALALLLANHLPIEIISVDSAQVYRDLNIGAAKPSAEELRQVPHHLIDICDPATPYSAARFVSDARQLISQIQSRGRLPVLAGGTMLYFKALLEGIDELPGANPAIRAQIDQQAYRAGWAGLHAQLANIDPAAAAQLLPEDSQGIANTLIKTEALGDYQLSAAQAAIMRAQINQQAHQLGWSTLHAELARVDPVTAARLSPGDSQRIQRALEVWRVTGKPLSQWFTANTNRQVQNEIVMFSLEPADRSWLHQRIAARFDIMLKQGFLDEVRALRTRKDLTLQLPAIRAVGYRQAWQAFDDAGSLNLTASQITNLREKAIVATRQLAKRQLTWLRSMPNRIVLTVGSDTQFDDLVNAVIAQLSTNRKIKQATKIEVKE